MAKRLSDAYLGGTAAPEEPYYADRGSRAKVERYRRLLRQRPQLVVHHLAQRDAVAQAIGAEAELDLACDEDLVHAVGQLRALHHLHEAVDAMAKLVERHELGGIDGQVEGAGDERLLTERLHRRDVAAEEPA